MKLDGHACQYLLSQRFPNVSAEGLTRGLVFDYPILYDVSANMVGHVVLVPDHERPADDLDMTGTLCVCTDEASARSSREAGAGALLVRGDATFQHLYNHMQRLFVENERLDAQLRALVDTYAGFEPLLRACARAVGYPCALIDNQYRLVCSVSPYAEADDGEGPDASSGAEVFEPDAIDLFMASREYAHMRASRTVFAIPGSGNLMAKNVFSKGQLVGVLIIEHNGDALSARYVRFLLGYLGSFVQEAYGRIGSFGVSSVRVERVKAAIQEALAGGSAGYASLAEVLAESGNGSSDEYVVLRVERSFTNEGAEEFEYLARRLELAWPYAYSFTREGVFYLLVNTGADARGEEESFAKQLPLVARENLAKMGMSRPFAEVTDLEAALAQAGIALEWGSEKDPTSWCYRFEDYAFSWLAAKASGGLAPEFVCHPAVTGLLRYDEAHGTDLLHTLSTFMGCRYNATVAAQELFVARSTLLHRLARIEELVGVDFENPAERAYLALSFAMLTTL